MTSTRLNLSSRPFRNRALPWTVTVIVALGAVLTSLFIVRASFQRRAQAEAIERNVADLQKQTNAIMDRTKAIKNVFTDEQAQTLKAAHALVDRKNFSWSRLFSDLEEALPGGVRLSRVTVKKITTQSDRTDADLELVVASKSPTTVTDMIDEMQRAGVFRAELVSQNTQRGRGETGAEYELNVHYIPRAGQAIDPAERGSRPVDTAASESNRANR